MSVKKWLSRQDFGAAPGQSSYQPRASLISSVNTSHMKQGTVIDQNGNIHRPTDSVRTGSPDVLTSAIADTFVAKPDSYKSLPRGIDPSRAPRSRFFDPLSLMYATGFKHRKHSVSFDTLRKVSYQLSVVGAIIKTRVHQISSFSKPYRENKQIGFQIRFKDEFYSPTEEDKRAIARLERMIVECGFGKNKYASLPRDNFKMFLRKIVRDTMTYDQACALPGTWVELADGTGVEIQNIEPGMKVRTHTGEIKEVLHPTSRLYSGGMKTIKVRGQKLHVTDGHPLFIAKRTSCLGNKVQLSKPEWIAAAEVTKNDYVVYPKPKLLEEDLYLNIFHEKPRSFISGDFDGLVKETGLHKATARSIISGNYKNNGPSVDLVNSLLGKYKIEYKPKRVHEEFTKIDKDWGRFLGFYVAEGDVQKNVTKLTFHENERDLVDFVRGFAERFGITSSVVEYKDRAGVTVILSSKALSQFLVKEFGTGSSQKRIPEFIQRSHRDVKNAFLGAYLEGDGNIRKSSCSFTTTSRDLFTGIRILFADLGIYISETTEDYSSRGWSTQYGGSLSGKVYRSFAKSVGIPVVDEGFCRNTSHEDDDYFYVKVTDVSSFEVANQRVYNMEVEEDHSYIASGFVNHNCFEVIPDRAGRPFEFRAVDASTIRFASNFEGYRGQGPKTFGSEYFSDNWRKVYGDNFEFDASGVHTVQVLHGRIENIFTYNDLALCIRNPRTDLWVNAYGFSELEQGLNTVLSMIWAEEYNRRAFSQGSHPKGILNVKGENISPDQIEAFKRQWYASMAGVENSWKTPILQADDMQYQNLQNTNREMEFNLWLDYLRKTLCSIYDIDPTEIGFDGTSGGVSGQQPMFESKKEWKIKHSKDRGLRPLLDDVASWISQFIVDPLDSRLYFDFVGLDELSEVDRIELQIKKATTYKTINEVREEEGLDPVVGGDIISSGIHLQSKQMDMANKGPTPESEMAPWPTSGDGQPPEYGKAPGVPLWLQGNVQPPAPPGGGIPQ